MQKLDTSNIPNAYANLSDPVPQPRLGPGPRLLATLAERHLDRHRLQPQGDRRQEGRVGLPSCSTTPALKGRVGLLTEMRDTVGLTMLDMGKDPAKFTDDDFDAAIATPPEGRGQRPDPPLHRQRLHQRLAKGDLAACIAWAGDVVQLQADNPDIGYVIPDSGYMTSTDNFLIPNKAQPQEERRAADRLLLRAGGPAADSPPTSTTSRRSTGREALAGQDRQGLRRTTR